MIGKDIFTRAMNYQLFTIYYLLFLTGCATAPHLIPPPSPIGIPGVYHRVEKGQTLWRISKIYNADLEKIAEVNHIGNAANIEVGQLIFIPHYQKPLPAPPLQYPTEDFIWPLKGKVVLGFGQGFANTVNKGINIQPGRQQNVVAVRSGKVVFYSPDFLGFGKTLILEHGDGFFTVYARNSEVFIKTGDRVERGAVIAKVQSSGKGTYLHFEIRKDYIAQNPYFYLAH